MPLALKNIGGPQKFRIPFKNLSEHDFEVEFNFMQTSSAVSRPALQRSDSLMSAGNASPKQTAEGESPQQSPIEFSIQPNIVKIPAGAQAVMLMISAKLKNSYQLSAQTSQVDLQRSLSEPLSEKSEVPSMLTKSVSESQRLKRMLSTNIEKYNHLLVGKVRDTNMMFSFIVEASVIDVD